MRFMLRPRDDEQKDVMSTGILKSIVKAGGWITWPVNHKGNPATGPSGTSTRGGAFKKTLTSNAALNLAHQRPNPSTLAKAAARLRSELSRKIAVALKPVLTVGP